MLVPIMLRFEFDLHFEATHAAARNAETEDHKCNDSNAYQNGFLLVILLGLCVVDSAPACTADADAGHAVTCMDAAVTRFCHLSRS